MGEEKKEYSVIGTVTIGTDEYRDLLTDKFQAQKERDDYYSKYWEKYSQVSKLEERVKELTTQLEQLRKYIKDNNEQDKLELWIVRSSRED